MSKYVVIVNGKPRSGKTTFEEKCRSIIVTRCYNARVTSTVDKMYRIFKELGWHGDKTDEFRADMSTLKGIYKRICNGPVIDAFNMVMAAEDKSIIFIDCREPEEIKEFVDIFGSLRPVGIYVTTLYVSRHSEENKKFCNQSDDDVADFVYRDEIRNDGTLDELGKKAMEYVNMLIRIMEGK